MSALDSRLIHACSPKLLKEEYSIYKKVKTDAFNHKKVQIPMGADGVTWKAFEKDLDHQVVSMSKRMSSGSYFFYPFREVHVPKDSHNHRIISIASIRDVLVQRRVQNVLRDELEKLFSQLPAVSYAYRSQFSASQAVMKVYQYIKEGYHYVLDADIKNFFDEIPHSLLLAQFEKLFQKESPLLHTLLKRYISTDRVEWKTYEGNLKLFYKQKPKRTHREKGIPQGGALSGLLANLYLHPFDEWVVNGLGQNMDIKYIRYADDFIILTHDKFNLETIKNQTREKLSEIGLQLHPDQQKTKLVHVAEQSIDFLGFNLSPTGVRISKHNIRKFKQRIRNILTELDADKVQESDAKKVIGKIQYKLLGNETNGMRICQTCKKVETRRSWLQFFLCLTDVQQLKGLDLWIRKTIHLFYFKQTGKRLKRHRLIEMNIQRLEQLYYVYRKEIGKRTVCTCSPLVADFRRESILNVLFKRY